MAQPTAPFKTEQQPSIYSHFANSAVCNKKKYIYKGRFILGWKTFRGLKKPRKDLFPYTARNFAEQNRACIVTVFEASRPFVGSFQPPCPLGSAVCLTRSVSFRQTCLSRRLNVDSRHFRKARANSYHLCRDIPACLLSLFHFPWWPIYLEGVTFSFFLFLSFKRLERFEVSAWLY